jgi:rubrerythrin
MSIQECTDRGRPGLKYGENGLCHIYHQGNEAERAEAERLAYVDGYAVEGDKVGKSVEQRCLAKVASTITNPHLTAKGRAICLKGLADEIIKNGAIVDAIELDIMDEQRAIDTYKTQAAGIDDAPIKELLLHIAGEEQTHFDELSKVLATLQQKAVDAADVHVDAPLPEKKDLDNGTVTKSISIPIQKLDEYQHKVFGIVLSPDEVDLQGDIITKEEIEKASDLYMERYQQVGEQHERQADAFVVQNYIAPVDFMLGTELVKAGAWVMCIKVNDPNIWEDVVSGKITGLSIGGMGHRTPAN